MNPPLCCLAFHFVLHRRQLRFEFFANPLPVRLPRLPLNVGRSTRSHWECVVKKDRHLQDTFTSFGCLFYLLLDRVVLRLERENGTIAIGDGIKMPGRLIGIQNDQLRHHEVTEHLDLVFVLNSANHTIKKVERVDASVRVFQQRV